MRKRQIFMLLIAIWLAIIIPACRQNIQPTLYEDNPVIVGQPIVNRTVFTNWEEIKLTYIIGWLDGYVPLFEDAKPENMSFGPFELDPAKSQKLELRNKRKHRKENYIDAIYYLGYIGEKKGDIAIPEQTFRYRKEEAGKPIEGSEAHDVKAPGIMLRYDSVLTKNADDIIDRVDFGSFKKQEYLWDGAIGGVAVIMCAVLFLLFRNPVTLAGKTRKTKAVITGQATDVQEERLAPKYALIHLSNQFLRLRAELMKKPEDQPEDQKEKSKNQKLHETRATICNELWHFFLSYVPDLKEGEFVPDEIRNKISQIPEKRERELLVVLANYLEEHDGVLRGQKVGHDLLKDIDTMRKVVSDLDGWNIWLFNKLQGWLKLKKQLARLLGRAK